MNFRVKIIFLAISALVLLVSPLTISAQDSNGKHYDFEFKGMDFRKVVASIARLLDKNILFSSKVESRPIDLYLTDVTAPTAFDLILKNYGYFAVEEGNVLHVMAVVERGPASNTTTLIPLHHVLARDIEANIKSFTSAQGSVSINDQQNALVVAVPDEMLPKIRKLVEELDQEGSQVFIEAKIVETSTAFARQLGVNWGPTSGSTTTGVSLKAPSGDNAFTAGFANLLSLNAQILAGENNGKLKVLSSPKISTLNGVAATIDSLTTYSVRTLTALGGGTGGATSITANTPGTATSGLQEVKAGITLQVTPFIVSNRQVRLKINLSKSDPDFAQAIDGIPGIATNDANTSLTVRSGETASIGGLIQHTISNNKEGVPFLSKIPFLGGLFGSNTDSTDDREILIFLTPTIYKVGTEPVTQSDFAEEKPEREGSQKVYGDTSQPSLTAPAITDEEALKKFPANAAAVSAPTPILAAPLLPAPAPIGKPPF